MILATDVHYYGKQAKATGILFKNWNDQQIEKEISVTISDVKEYVSGSFYKRELPCLLELIQAIETEITCIIVDGFVFLGKEKKAGLGKYLYEALDQKTPIIGVAKNGFEGTPENTQIWRGNSKKPLFITAIGLEQEQAKNYIKQMHGENRFPTQLKLVDSICRKIE